MFPAIRTTFAVSLIGLGLIALALPAQAQDFRGKGFAAPKAERNESPSRLQRINVPKAEREQPRRQNPVFENVKAPRNDDVRRIDVIERGNRNQRFNTPKAERFDEPSRQRFQAPKAERFQSPREERFERAEAPVRRRFVERSEPKFVASEEAVVRSEAKIVKAKAPKREIVEDETPVEIVKTKQHVANAAPKVIQVDSADDEYGYYDDYGYYTDAGYSDHSYANSSCH